MYLEVADSHTQPRETRVKNARDAPVMLTFCSHESQMPVWKRLSTYLSSPVSHTYCTTRESFTSEPLKRMQKDWRRRAAGTAAAGPVQSGFATFRVPSHQ